MLRVVGLKLKTRVKYKNHIFFSFENYWNKTGKFTSKGGKNKTWATILINKNTFNFRRIRLNIWRQAGVPCLTTRCQPTQTQRSESHQWRLTLSCQMSWLSTIEPDWPARRVVSVCSSLDSQMSDEALRMCWPWSPPVCQVRPPLTAPRCHAHTNLTKLVWHFLLNKADLDWFYS